MGEIDDRSEFSRCTVARFKGETLNAEALVAKRACIYATGSFGRNEASEFSDLDLFLLVETDNQSGKELPLLSPLDEICVKADLVQGIRKLGIPDFDGGGRYLEPHSVRRLIDTLGKPEDDSTNRFTARLLLLLESRPILEEAVYERALEQIIGAYWQDFEDHRDDFYPAFLINDILRLWRTFCVNYEARTERSPEEKKAKRKLKNYKLKHSRLLTCYSAVMFFQHIFSTGGTVTPTNAVKMATFSPIERLDWLMSQTNSRSVRIGLRKLRTQYETFLSQCRAKESYLVDQFLDKKFSTERMNESELFGQTVYEVINSLGANDKKLYRRLLV